MKKAFSLAEILLTLMIVAVVALMSTSVVKSKKKKVEDPPSEGMYACTIFNGSSYVFESPNNKATIPASISGWTKKRCLDGFTPPKDGVVEVITVGAGGGGGNGGTTTTRAMQETSFHQTGGFFVDGTGYYDFEIRGTKGGVSTLFFTNPTVYRFPDAQAGTARMISGTVYLEKGDTIDIKFTPGSKAVLPNSSCKNGIDIYFVGGNNGDNIHIYKNGYSMGAYVLGSKAGNYSCNPGQALSYRFSVLTGSTATANFAGATDTNSDLIYSDYGVVYVKWSDKNESKDVVNTDPGCGGRSGSINSTLYPILSKKLPDVEIGLGGTNGNDGGDTRFGSLTAIGGGGDMICEYVGTNPNNGSNGSSLASPIGNATWAGGAAGKTTSVNGSNGVGFGSGGGGGAISGSYTGRGGSGAPGLLILRW